MRVIGRRPQNIYQRQDLCAIYQWAEPALSEIAVAFHEALRITQNRWPALLLVILVMRVGRNGPHDRIASFTILRWTLADRTDAMFKNGRRGRQRRLRLTSPCVTCLQGVTKWSLSQISHISEDPRDGTKQRAQGGPVTESKRKIRFKLDPMIHARSMPSRLQTPTYNHVHGTRLSSHTSVETLTHAHYSSELRSLNA